MTPNTARRSAGLFLSASTGLALVLAAYVCLAGTSSAIAAEPTQEQRAACAEDFKRLCPGTRPGGGRVKQCFSQHQAELSPACSAAFGEQTAAEG